MRAMRCMLLIALCALATTAATAQERDYNFHPIESLVRIYPSGSGYSEALGRIDLTYVGSGPYYHDFLVRPAQLDALIDAGLAFDVLVEDYWGWQLEQGHDAPPADYTDYTELVTFLNQVVGDHPAIAQLHDLGATAGGTRRLWALKISDNVATDEPEPEVAFDAAIHGNELVGTELLISVINQLTDGYDRDWDMTELVNGAEIWFVPLVNPDGQMAGSRYNADGKDLNRDFGYMWEAEGNTTSPISQAESRLLTGLWMDNQFSMGTSYHGGATVFLWAWSYTYETPPDTALMDYLGGIYCGYAGYTRYQGAGLYGSPYHGSTKDAFYGTFGAPAWTIEISSSYAPPYAQVPAIVDLNDDGVFALLNELDTGVRGTITDSQSGDPVEALLWIDPNGWVAYNDPQVGDYFRVLRPGTYQLTAWAPGYQAQSQQNVIVVEGSRTEVDFELVAQATPVSYGLRWLYSYMTNSESTTTLTIDALGPPDGGYVTIGNNGYAVIDLGPSGVIEDVAGDDIIVTISGSEPYALHGSNQPWHVPDGNWHSLGSGTGTATFDLSGSGLSSVRYLRVDNRSKGVLNLDALGGYYQMIVDFVGDPTAGPAPLTVQFTDLSECLTGEITGWSWSFGDGNNSSEQNPQHVYLNSGSYSVQLSVSSTSGSDTATRLDYIQVSAPDDDDDDDDLDDDDSVDDDDDDDSGSDDDDDDDDGSCCG